MGDNAQAGFYWSSLGDPRDNESAALSWRERRRGSADFVIFFFFFFSGPYISFIPNTVGFVHFER